MKTYATGGLLLAMLSAAISVGSMAAEGPRPETVAPDVRAIEGRIVDSKTHEPVPFVNVGIPQASLGTVGGEDGRFWLDGAPGDSVLIFSAIGYRTHHLPVAALADDGVIRLTAVEIGYREKVSVTAEATGKPKVFGKKYKERGYGMGFGSGLLGAELGARIPIAAPTYLESASFIVAHRGGERFLYRVNIYDFKGGEIGANLLEENVLLAAKQKRGTLTVDLREHGLIARDDVLLTLEWIRDDRDVGNANVMFRARPRSKGNLYLKLTSLMPFRKIKGHNLGFYLVGYSLE